MKTTRAGVAAHPELEWFCATTEGRGRPTTIVVALSGHAERRERAGGARGAAARSARSSGLRSPLCCSPRRRRPRSEHRPHPIRPHRVARPRRILRRTAQLRSPRQKTGSCGSEPRHGLIRFDGVRFMPWQPPAGSQLPDDRIINLLESPRRQSLDRHRQGLAQWRAPNLVVHTRAGRFGALLEDRQGTIWAGHTRALAQLPPLCRSVARGLPCFGFPDEYGLHYVRALHEDRQGNVWLGGDRGVCRWQPETPENPECYAIGSPAQATDGYTGLPPRRRLRRHPVGGDLWTRGSGGSWQAVGRAIQPARTLSWKPMLLLSDRGAACGSVRSSTGSCGSRGDGRSGSPAPTGCRATR